MNNQYQYDRSQASYDPYAFAYKPPSDYQGYEGTGPTAPYPTSPPPPPPAEVPQPALEGVRNNTGDLIDLLDTPAVPPAAASSPTNMLVMVPWTPTTGSQDDNSSVPADLLESQQRMLDEISRRKKLEESDEAIARALALGHPQNYNHHHSSRAYGASRAMTTYQYPSRSYDDASLRYGTSEAVHPLKNHMKQARPYKTAAGAAGGAVLGGVVMAPVFPVGMMLGGVAGGMATNKACKAGEKRAQRKWEQNSFQRGTESSLVAAHVKRDGTGLV